MRQVVTLHDDVVTCLVTIEDPASSFGFCGGTGTIGVYGSGGGACESGLLLSGSRDMTVSYNDLMTRPLSQ